MRTYAPASTEAVLERLLEEPSLARGVIHHEVLPARGSASLSWKGEVNRMIRQATAWIVTLTFVLGPTALVFAQGTQTAPAQAPATSPAAPAAKKVATKSATGTVKSTTADSLMLVTEGKDKKTKEWTFVLDKDTKITKAGKPAEAKDLAEKDMATVTYTEAEGKMHAKSVVVKKAS